MINRANTAKDQSYESLYSDQLAQNEEQQLTTNQRMVYEALLSLERSAGAYELLSLLRKRGVNAAATVYRALKELAQKGLVQRIISTRTYVALVNPKSKTDESILLICRNCGEVSSIKDNNILEAFDRNIKQSGYRVNRYHLELLVTCDQCSTYEN